MDAKWSVLFKGIKNGVMNLGWSKPKSFETSVDTDGNFIGYMNFSDTTSSTGDLQFFVRFRSDLSSGLAVPDSRRTRLHNGGFAESQSMVEIFIEDVALGAAPTTAQKDLVKLAHDVVHVFRAANSASVTLYQTADGTTPALSGLAGAVADVTGNLIAQLPPYGRGFPTGNFG